ncbi:MAG: endolytic transglycosylase MltG [Endomicrobium sp.]|jgi:UPF0755 protein|nr:endolytic transglycosylase MltG [Endomicrobium sp.]
MQNYMSHTNKIKNIIFLFLIFSCYNIKNAILRTINQYNTRGKIVRVTIPEGKDIKETAELIGKALPINKKTFIQIARHNNMEGYLMPETYFFNIYMNERQIIDTMYKEFTNKITHSMYDRAKKLHLTFHEIVTLASIIEKEVSKPYERRTVAAVFYNRLGQKIKLQSCATVLYAIGQKKLRLTNKDTCINSPYNTYKYFGLPPGPICNPSLDSIKAALYPTNSKLLFFVSTGHGTHLFARNFRDHKKNKQLIKRDLNDKKKNLLRQ